jgi:hypothetical protein
VFDSRHLLVCFKQMCHLMKRRPISYTPMNFKSSLPTVFKLSYKVPFIWRWMREVPVELSILLPYNYSKKLISIKMKPHSIISVNAGSRTDDVIMNSSVKLVWKPLKADMINCSPRMMFFYLFHIIFVRLLSTKKSFELFKRLDAFLLIW